MQDFWDTIDKQLKELSRAVTADDVIRILASPGCTGDAFFAGSGGDGTVWEALREAGWEVSRHSQSWIHYRMLSPNGGDEIEYIEGDIYRRTAEQCSQCSFGHNRGDGHCERHGKKISS